MSISQNNVIDAMGISNETGQVVLTISDHLRWGNEHLLMLQEKINLYLAFVESGELIEKYPDASGREVLISVVCKYPPDMAGTRFLSKIGIIMEGAGLKMLVHIPLDS